MKIKSLILCFMVFVTGSIVAQERDLFIKNDKSIVVKVDTTQETIIKGEDDFYIIPHKMEIKSIGREIPFESKQPLQVSYNNKEKYDILSLSEGSVFKNKKIIIAPDTITQVFWGEDVLKLKLQSQASTDSEAVDTVTCDLILKKDTVILNGDTLLINRGAFVNNKKEVIIIKSMKLEPPCRVIRDVIVTQIETGNTICHVKAQSLLSSNESPNFQFPIQPNTKIQIVWGDYKCLIDSTTQPSIKDWIEENLYWLIITAFLVVFVVFGWYRYCKQKHNIKELLDKSNEIIKDTIFFSEKLVNLIEDENKDGRNTSDPEGQTKPESKSDVVQVSENLESISKLILNIESLDYFNCANSDGLEKICANRPKIKEVLGICKPEKIDYNTIDDILNALDKTLSEKSRSLNDIIKAPTPEEIPYLQKYVGEWLRRANFRYVSNSDICLCSKPKKDKEDELRNDKSEKDPTQQESSYSKSKPNDADVQRLLLEYLQRITGSSAESIDLILKEVESNAIKNEFEGKTVDQINKIIGAYNKVKGLLDKYPADTSDELKAAIERSIIKEISERIQLDEECEKYDCLKDLIDSIKKSENANKLASGLLLKLHKMSVVLNTLTTEKMKANQDKEDIEEKVVNEIKKQYKDFSEDELIADSPLNAIQNFVSRVKRVINLKDKKISDLNADVYTKEQMVKEFQSKLDNNQKTLKGLYQSYTSFIVSTFEQIEKNVQQSCNASDKSSPLVKKINERIISNDSWGLSDFVEEMKKPTETNLNIDEMNEKIKSLFTRCLRFSSWIDILAQIYIYIQEPTLAGKLTALGLDTVKVNQAFVLTETMMSIVGIKLQYPKLFTDTFDEKCFEKESLSEIQDLVEDFRDLVDIRPGLIIDLIRVGYSFDETKKKAIVVIDM